MGCGNSKSTSVVTLQPNAHTAEPASLQPTSPPRYSPADPVHGLHQQGTADTSQQPNGLHQQATADPAHSPNDQHPQATASATTDHDGQQQNPSRPQDGAADHTDRHTHDTGSQEQESRQPAVLNNDAAKDSEQDHVTRHGGQQNGSQDHDLNSRGKGSSQPVVQDRDGASEEGSKPDDPTEDGQHHDDSQAGGMEGQSPDGSHPAAPNPEALSEGGLNPGSHTPDKGYHNGSPTPDQDGPQSAPHNQHETSGANSTPDDHNQDDNNEDDTKTSKDADSADRADEVQTSQTQDPPQQHEQTDISPQGDSEDPKSSRDDDVVKQPPPFRPPTKTKDQVVPDPSIFKEVDEYVRNIDNKSAGSVESLAQALTSPFQEDLLKIRALFSWLAFNISYDTDSYFSGNTPSQAADSVLQSRTAVCQGYSELFDGLCKIANIPCVLVSGIAKGYSHDPEAVYTAESKTNHAWNLVLLDGEWRPLDSTWGAGHVKRGGDFVREYTEFWFLTDPDKFVLRHFPLQDKSPEQSQRYQLLSKPLSIEEFSASVHLTSDAQDMGMVCLTHDHTVIDVTGDVTIKVKATTRSLESVDVKLKERRSEVVQEKGSHVVTYMSDDGTCNIYVRPPRAATYLLDIYGRTEGEESSSLHQLLTYVIRCQKPRNDVQPFPDKFGTWGVRPSARSQLGLRQDNDLISLDAVIYTAKEGEVDVPLCLNDSSTVTTNLRHALDDHDLEHHTMVDYTKQGISICARLPKPGYYALKLFAKDKSAEGSLPHAGDLLLYSDTAQHECRPFPTVYGLAKDLRARLLEPRYGQVAAGQPTLYRVHAAGVAKMTIGGQKAELKNDGVWEATVTPGGDVTHLTVFAGLDDSNSLKGLYQFTVVQ